MENSLSTSQRLNGLQTGSMVDLKQVLFISCYLYGFLDSCSTAFNIFINIENITECFVARLADHVKIDRAANVGVNLLITDGLGGLVSSLEN